MNSKIRKLKAEHRKNESRIEAYRSRNAEIDKQITELENLDIIGMVRSIGMTPEQLERVIRGTEISGMEVEREVSDDE